jgi:hypothetical protein
VILLTQEDPEPHFFAWNKTARQRRADEGQVQAARAQGKTSRYKTERLRLADLLRWGDLGNGKNVKRIALSENRDGRQIEVGSGRRIFFDPPGDSVKLPGQRCDAGQHRSHLA